MIIGNDWDQVLAREMEKPYYKELEQFLDAEYASCTVFPPRDEIFMTFKYTPYDDVKVHTTRRDRRMVWPFRFKRVSSSRLRW